MRCYSDDVLLSHVDIAHARFVQGGIQQFLFVVVEITLGFGFKHAEDIDIVFGHIQVDGGLAATGAQLAR